MDLIKLVSLAVGPVKPHKLLVVLKVFARQVPFVVGLELALDGVAAMLFQLHLYQLEILAKSLSILALIVFLPHLVRDLIENIKHSLVEILERSAGNSCFLPQLLELEEEMEKVVK